jgi:hypothetical protein
VYVVDLLAWWCKMEEEFGHVTRLAKLIHANPALSAASKGSFSNAGRVIQD